jgi:Family of unknown function (DUF5372)
VDSDAHRHNWGEDRVYLHDENGELFSLPAGWTDVGPAGPFVVIAGGRCPFTVEGLLALADLIGYLRSRLGSGAKGWRGWCRPGPGPAPGTSSPARSSPGHRSSWQPIQPLVAWWTGRQFAFITSRRRAISWLWPQNRPSGMWDEAVRIAAAPVPGQPACGRRPQVRLSPWIGRLRRILIPLPGTGAMSSPEGRG